MNRINIFCDMDGVLTQFAESALVLLNKKYNKNYTIEQYASEYGEFGMDIFYGITQEEFWSVINEDEYFWYNLEPYPWAGELIDLLKGFGDVTIVTAPSEDPACSYFKIKWLQEHFGFSVKDIILCHKKYLLAGNGILVDDYKKNVNEFLNNGGDAILVPATWNTVGLTKNDVFNAILDVLTFNEI